MHLNIPPKDETRSQYWLRSLKWVALGILIPELVVLSAWRQWLSARQMVKELEVILRSRQKKVNQSAATSGLLYIATMPVWVALCSNKISSHQIAPNCSGARSV
jgi:hypothetical protein